MARLRVNVVTTFSMLTRTTGYSKGYDDSSAGLTAVYRRLRISQRHKLRGAELELAEHFTNGYDKGYEMSQRALSSTKERH
jgi:hypothetical protein